MLRYIFASLVVVGFAAADASAQTTPRAARKKIAPYSSRGAAKPKVKINPHTGKPYGAGVPQDLKDGSYYLAPSMQMRKQEGYHANGQYNDNRARRPATKKAANSSLSRDSNAPAAVPAKTRK
ncbi:hypothetical protein I2I05_13455 [Hymenobacter sp. BT683]|uniref:Uncharacterized protein n=1 Tax=Hymenobacter jeongseonensis TaxID=2791027 RepID=A0ABS0IJ93_9BACT|nr:hypothetical protein [Hymenobacter jeongseonensis]MBF9238406.1 hypothetical protein [Hymenobacter jeongseonensis]